MNARRLSIVAAGCAVLGGVEATPVRAWAQQATEPAPPLPVGFSADELRLDPGAQAVEASGHVRVDEPPFHLTADALTLRRAPIGARLDGEGKLAFCPCLGTPIAVRFSGATLAPPHDVILRSPVLEVFGVPIAWAPAFWLRSPGRLGLLPPDVAWRGADGFFAGAGVHMPWQPGDLARGIDLRAGGYADGGVDVDVGVRTVMTWTRVTWDRLHDQDGIGVQAHGSTAIAGGDRIDTVAWDADALRGARAVKATTDLDAAARPFDRAEAEAAWRPAGWSFGSAVRWIALRGGDAVDGGAFGPIVAVRRSDAIGRVGAYDATFEGGQVVSTGAPATPAGPPGPTTFARAEGGATFATHLGAVGATMTVREVGVLLDDGTRTGVDGAAQVRTAFALPLVRGFDSGDESDPWVHRTEPRLEVGVLGTHASDGVLVPVARGATGPSGGAWVATGQWGNAVGRIGSRTAVEVDAIGGVVGTSVQAMPALRARASASGVWASLVADFARVLGPSSGTLAGPVAGGAFVARLRAGPEMGLNLTAHVAERDGVDPVLARVLVEAPLEPASGFLSATGWTGGAHLAIPLGSRVTTRGGVDVDLDARELVAAVGSLELHDPCGCVVVRATAAHRIGRDGVDAWVSVDLPIAGH